MAATPAAEARASARSSSTDSSYVEGSGWVLFAGIMLMLVGVLNAIYGIAAIDSSNFFVANTQYILSDLNTWGWVLLGLGVLQAVVALAVLAGKSGRSVGRRRDHRAQCDRAARVCAGVSLLVAQRPRDDVLASTGSPHTATGPCLTDRRPKPVARVSARRG